MATRSVEPDQLKKHCSVGDFCHHARDTEIVQKMLISSKHIDMTIHWKALEEHFLMVPLVFQFIFGTKKSFSEFFSEIPIS
jgi:hypothetical protein